MQEAFLEVREGGWAEGSLCVKFWCSPPPCEKDVHSAPNFHPGPLNLALPPQLMNKCQDTLKQIKHTKHIFVTGHSLGGALALFFTLHLWQDLGVLPAISIGFAGPFIGDEDFADTYQEPLKHLMGDQWWQART